MTANSGGSHNGRPSEFKLHRKYCRENTLIVDVRDNSRVKPDELIKFVHEHCGIGTMYACVPKSSNLYEITLDGRAPTQYLMEGIRIGERVFECKEVVQSSLIVSFLHLPAYIEDAEIENALQTMNVELLSPIKRRYSALSSSGSHRVKSCVFNHCFIYTYSEKRNK
jgi:hypothetical protein